MSQEREYHTIGREKKIMEEAQDIEIEINNDRVREIERSNYVSMGIMHGKYNMNPQRLYEIIVGGYANKYCFIERKSRIYKLFYDIDIVNKRLGEKEKERIQKIGVIVIKEKIIETIGEVMEEYMGKRYEYIYSDKRTVDNKAGDEYKLHIYYPEVEVDNEIAIFIRSKIIERLDRWELKGLWEEIIDISIYKGNGIRLLYQMKPNENEAYVINKKKSTYKAIPDEHIERLRLTSIRTESEEPNVRIIKGYNKIEKTEKQIKKPIRKVEKNVQIKEKRECNKMLTEYFMILSDRRIKHYATWNNVMMLCRNYGYYDIAHKISQKVENYNKVMIDNMFKEPPKYIGLTLSSLYKWAKEDNKEEYDRIREKYGSVYEYEDIDEILLEKYWDKVNYRETSKYITETAYQEMLKHDKILIQSGTGTGKSYTIDKILKANKEMSMLCVESIRTLARSHQKTFEELNMTCYLDGNESERYIISLEQVYKIKREYDIIILDEVSNLFEHLYSKTMNNTRRGSYEKLIYLMKHAKKVIFADANIRDDVMSQLVGLYGDKLFYYKNERKCSEDVKVKIMKAEKRVKDIDAIYNFLLQVKEKIRKQESISIASDSKKVCKIIVKILEEIGGEKGNILMYTSGIGDTKDISECNKIWRNKIVVYSPKILYAVDNQIEYQDNTTLAIYTGKSISSMNMFQQMCRNRKAKNINVLWLQKNEDIARYITYDRMCELENEKYMKYTMNIKRLNKEAQIVDEMLMYINKRGEKTMNMDTMMYEYHCRREWYKMIFRNGALKLLGDLLRKQGFEVVTEKLEIKEKTRQNIEKIMDDDLKEENEANMEYINGKMERNNPRYEYIDENIKNKMRYLDVSMDEIKNDKILKEIITTKGELEELIVCNELNMTQEEVKNKYTNQYANKVDMYGIFEMNKIGIYRANVLREIENICKIERKTIEDIDVNKIKIKFPQFIKKISDIKEEVGNVLYNKCSKKRKEEYMNKRISEIKNGNDIKKIVADVYNCYGKIIEIKHKKSNYDKGRIYQYEFTTNKQIYENINKIKQLIHTKKENIYEVIDME